MYGGQYEYEERMNRIYIAKLKHLDKRYDIHRRARKMEREERQMRGLLAGKEALKAFYARYSAFVNAFLRFITAFAAVFLINQNIGLMPETERRSGAAVCGNYMCISPIWSHCVSDWDFFAGTALCSIDGSGAHYLGVPSDRGAAVLRISAG